MKQDHRIAQRRRERHKEDARNVVGSMTMFFGLLGVITALVAGIEHKNPNAKPADILISILIFGLVGLFLLALGWFIRES